MNKKNWIILSTLLFIGGLALFTLAPRITAQSQNLISNPGFEGGHYNQDGIAEITVPNSWRMHWLDDVTFSDAWEGRVAYRPETVVWNAAGGIPEGEELFWRDGSYTLKIFKSWAPMYAALSQEVAGLEVGRQYQLSVPIYTDIYDWDDGKVAPWDATHGQVRLGSSTVGAPWRDEGAINYSTWFAAAYQEYGIYSYSFTATEPTMTIWIEMKGTYPHSNNGFFLDGVGMYATDQTDPNVAAGGGTGNTGSTGGGAPSAPAGPTATPFPTPTPRADGAIIHMVNSGDTFWSIAIRYAPALGVTAEQALPIIQELNNNPAFLSVGQELVIIAPGEGAETEAPAAVAEVPAEAGDTEAAESTETAGEEEAIVVEGDASALTTGDEPEGGEAPVEEASDALVPASICVSAFDDANGDGMFDEGSESLQADAAITLFRAGQTVSTYISDGISEPYCFENLEDDVYQVQIFPPADFETTGADTWAVAVSAGVSMPVSFGTQPVPVEAEPAADAGSTAVETNSAAAEEGEAETAVDTPAEETSDTAEAADEGGFFSNIGGIIIALAVVLVLLAGVGIVLLRRA